MAEVSEQEAILEELVEKRESVDEGAKFRGTEDEGDDLEHIPLEEVFQKLKCSMQGLSTAEAERRLQIVGPNKLEEHKENRIMKFLMFMWNPLSWVMEVAAFLALVVDNGENKPPDWQDFVGIVCLLIINSTVSYLEEHNAGMAAAALMQQLAPRARVLRDGAYKEEDAACIVPGDVITIKLGDVIPADARLLEGDPLQVDQSALTGESIAVIKWPGEEVFSGSICKQGEIEAIVIATGVSTFFGKAAHLVDSTQHTGHFQSVLRTIGNFCICTIVIGLVIEIIVIYGVQRRHYREGIENMLVLLIGGIPIAMPTVLSVTMAVGSHGLATQGAIVKRMTAIEEMAGMDILCSDKTGTLTLNRLTVDKSLIEVLSDEVDAYLVILTAARASRLENQDAIDSAVVGMLGDPSEARENIQELHFLPFNPTDKRTAITYLTPDGKMHRATKGSPEQVLALITGEDEIKRKVHDIICRYADRGLRTLAVAYQEIPEGIKESEGGPWLMYGLLPLFDPPRHDTAETVRNALELGVNVKMITGDQLAIAKETGRRLGMGINMYPSSSLFQTGGRQSSSAGLVEMDEGELVEQADGFAGVFPEHKFLIVKKLQERKHIVGMTGDGVNDAPALKKADIGIAVADATDAARNAADIVLTQPGLSVIIHAILTSRCIFQRMKNYTIYAVTITVRIVLGFLLLSLTWRFNFSPFMILIIAILNDGTIMTISKDRVKPSQYPDSWKLPEVFAQGTSLGVYLALSTLFFYWLIHETQFFEEHFKVHRISGDSEQETAAIYLQVSIVSQALIFVTRSQSWSFLERPGVYLVIAFVIAQLVATIIAAHANWGFAKLHGCGWGWAGVIWLYSLVIYLPLDIIKFLTRYILSGRAWDHVMESKVAFTRKKNYGREARQAQWAAIARTAVSSPETVPAISSPIIPLASSTMGTEISVQARRRAEVAKLAELHVLKGHNEAIAKLRTLDENAILQSHTV